jgi:hypothetical protein
VQDRMDERKLGRDGWVGQGGFTGRSSAVRGWARTPTDRGDDPTSDLSAFPAPTHHPFEARAARPSCQPLRSTQVEGLVNPPAGR